MGIQALEQAVANEKSIYLYGAGIVAYGACQAIRTLYSYSVAGYVVTGREGNPQYIRNVPVCELSSLKGDRGNMFFLIAVPEQYHLEIAGLLREYKHVDCCFLDADMEYELMGKYMKKVHKYQLVEDIDFPVMQENNTYIGMAISIYDKKLQNNYQEAEWIHKIQVGAALTTERIAETSDEGVDTISAQNPIYGELTATYWIWKSINMDILGIYHYRRILEIQKKELDALSQGIIDVILPLPFVCERDTSGQYGRYLHPEDVTVMKQVLQRRASKNWMEIERVLKGECLYNYNILVGRREVFKDYCQWMFPILQEISEICGKEPRQRLPRYIGRIGEVLTAVYFLVNWKHWKIAHAKKIWRV